MDKLKEVSPKYSKWYNVSKNGKVTLNRNRLTHHLSLQWDYLVASNGVMNGIFHMYKDGAYIPVHRLEPFIKPYIYIDNQSPDAVRSIADGLRQIQSVEFDELHGDENIINLQNGLYDIKRNVLKPHSKEYVSSVQLKCNYNEKTYNAGKWDKYIKELTQDNEESILFLQEVAGVILSNIKGFRLKSIIGLQGKGDSGKTQFFNIMGKMLGNDLVGTASLQKLSNSQFIGSSIYGKRIVFDGDLPSDPLSNVDIIKKLSGGDVISIEFKGVDSFNYRFPGIIVFACNDMPYLGNDKGEHFYNRFNILQCNNVIPKNQQNPFLADEIFNEESDYVFKWVTERKVISNLRENIKNEQDSVRAFVTNSFEITNNHDDKIKLSALFNQYEIFCLEEGYNACKRKSFRSKLEVFYNLKITKPQNKETIHGIIIK